MWAGKSKDDFDSDTQELVARLDELIESESLTEVDGFELYPGRMILDPHKYAVSLQSSLRSQNAAARRAGDVEERLRIFIAKVGG